MNKKSKDVFETVKQKVLKRQNNLSISGVWLGNGVNYHHIKPRSHGGLGIEENIVALTPLEHRELHDHQSITVNGKKYYTYDEFQTLIRNHMRRNYKNWG